MQHDIAAFIAEHAEEFGEEVRLYENYSGRGMYGDTTTGLVMSHQMVLPTLLLQMNEIIHEAVEDGRLGLYQVESLRFDSLGRDVIIY